MFNNTINHPYHAYISPGQEHQPWQNDAKDFAEKVARAASCPGRHKGNREKMDLAWACLNVIAGVTNSLQQVLTCLPCGTEMSALAPGRVLPEHIFAVHDTVPSASQADNDELSLFKTLQAGITTFWRDPLLFPVAAAEQASENEIISNEIPLYPQPARPSATEKIPSVLPVTRPVLKLQPNITAIKDFQEYYQQRHPAHPLTLAKAAIETVMAEKFNLTLDASHVWLHSFPLGEGDPRTITGFAHNVKPERSERLDELVLKNFNRQQWENEFSMGLLNALYNQSATETSHFGVHNEVRITLQQLMDAIWEIDFSQVYRTKLDEFWSKPRLQEMENLVFYIVNAARHFHNLQPEDQEIFHQGWGLREDKTSRVKRYLFDIGGYAATDIVILRRTDSPKVYIFEPRLENPFRVFHSEFDMQSWFINRCADAAERQKIALAFPVAARIKGFVKWGVDQYLQAMGDTQKDPNAYLQYIATDRRPLQGSLAIQLADRQKERDYADLPYEITSHAAIRTARWASYFDVINMIFPNPATLLVSWGMALDQMLNGASWQARKQGAGKFFTYTAFLFTAALDGVAGRALDMGEEWMTASAEGEGGLAGVIRAEAGDLESDYTQLLLAHKLGVEALPPELNVHNRPLRVYPAVENSVKERGIIPAPVEFEQLGPPEENGLLSGLRAGDNDKKYVQIKNQFYEVFYDSEADEYYLGDKNAERLPLFIDEEHKVAFEKPFSAREIQNLPSLCRTRRAPGTSAGVTCSVQISAKARQALDDNIASAIPAEEIDNKLEVFNDRRALFRKKGTEEIYFKYADHYFPTKITNPQGYIANLSLKIKAKTPWKKLLGKSSKLDLWLVPDRQSRSGMTLAMKDEVKEIMLNLKRGGLPIVETYIEQEQTLSREEISAITQYVNSSSNAIREFCVKKKLSGPEVYSVKWLQREAEYALQFIRSGLKKIKPHTGKVFHGGSLKEALLNKLQVGDYVSNAAFLSASEDKSAALLHQPVVSQLYAGTKQILLEIEGQSRGHSVMKYSSKQYEQEVLFEDNTVFRVKALDKENHRLVLEEVPVEKVPTNKKIYYLDDWLLMEKDSEQLHTYRPASNN